MSENNKRSYTVPVLFIIIMVLLTLIIIFYSKLLLTQQTLTTDQGKRLSEQYVYAILFTQQLHDGSDKLLNAKSEVDRLSAMKMIGEAVVASGETSSLLVEAIHRNTGQSKEEAATPIVKAINRIIGIGSIMETIDKQDGPLTEKEKASLTIIRDGTAQLSEAFSRFRYPTGEAGFRQMITVADWIEPVLEAGESLKEMANKL